MFSENGKISEKQLGRMIMLPVFVSIILVLPYGSAKLFGNSIVPGLLLFLALAACYVLYIFKMGQWYAKYSCSTGEQGFVGTLVEGGLVGKFLMVLQVVRLILRLVFYIMLTIAILFEARVPFIRFPGVDISGNLFVVLPLLLVALYGTRYSVEKQGRMHEMLFWFILIPFAMVLIFGLKEVNFDVFFPRQDMSLGKLLMYGYVLLVLVLPMEQFLYLRPSLGIHEGKKRIWVCVIGAIFLGVLMTFFALGIYGVNGAAKNPMTPTTIMSYISLPFGILERFDVIILPFFIIGCFLLICETLYFAKYIIDCLREKKTSLWALVFLLLPVLLIVAVVGTYENALMTYGCYAAIIDIPLSLILPVLGMGIATLYER